jgi:hypothetical protein
MMDQRMDDDDMVVNTVDVDPIYAEEAVSDQRMHSSLQFQKPTKEQWSLKRSCINGLVIRTRQHF